MPTDGRSAYFLFRHFRLISRDVHLETERILQSVAFCLPGSPFENGDNYRSFFVEGLLHPSFVFCYFFLFLLKCLSSNARPTWPGIMAIMGSIPIPIAIQNLVSRFRSPLHTENAHHATAATAVTRKTIPIKISANFLIFSLHRLSNTR